MFDLDPVQGADILTCARVAFLLRDLLDDLALRSFVKVSGSKGLQVYTPLNTDVTYALTQPFAKATAELLAEQHPKLVVADMAKALRKGKVFIDWSQNSNFKQEHFYAEIARMRAAADADLADSIRPVRSDSPEE